MSPNLACTEHIIFQINVQVICTLFLFIFFRFFCILNLSDYCKEKLDAIVKILGLFLPSIDLSGTQTPHPLHGGGASTGTTRLWPPHEEGGSQAGKPRLHPVTKGAQRGAASWYGTKGYKPWHGASVHRRKYEYHGLLLIQGLSPDYPGLSPHRHRQDSPLGLHQRIFSLHLAGYTVTSSRFLGIPRFPTQGLGQSLLLQSHTLTFQIHTFTFNGHSLIHHFLRLVLYRQHAGSTFHQNLRPSRNDNLLHLPPVSHPLQHSELFRKQAKGQQKFMLFNNT